MYYLLVHQNLKTKQEQRLITDNQQAVFYLLKFNHFKMFSSNKLLELKKYTNHIEHDYQNTIAYFGYKKANPKLNQKVKLVRQVHQNIKPDYYLYTDGGHRFGTNQSAWAYALCDQSGYEINHDTQGMMNATNNQMEIQGLLSGLSYLYTTNRQDAKILIVSDSKYLINSVSDWMLKWYQHDWTKKGGLKNADLWQEVFQLIQHFKDLNILWVKGHDSTKGNIEVDSLLNKTMDQM